MASSPTKKAWKLQEFVAHGGNVNCLALGHKSGRVMVTGGEDKKVNMWAVGKPNCIMSLSGHTSPVEAVRFGNAEEMVVAGSMSGALKIWDLEAAKILRTLTGHKSNIRSLDFHPYGDFVASGSLDTNLKLWDIRRKGCIFTYKGHTNCVNSIRFSPDGRWIASAGEDGLLKLWDLTAGKLLNDFKLHTGPVNTVEFHPNEFLLASGSSDRTVKFWDLESFQLVSSTDSDSTPVRCIFFHPEGQCMYSGAQDQMKVFGWEPARCFDSLSTGWGKVVDVAIAQNQVIAGGFSQNNVSTFVVDISRVQPIGGSPMQPNSPPPMSSSGRRSFINERPPTQCTRQTSQLKEEPPESLAGGDDNDDDQTSGAQITDQRCYEEVFQPRHTLPRDQQKQAGERANAPASKKRPEPFQAPPDEGVSQPTSRAPPTSSQAPNKPTSGAGRSTAPPVEPAPVKAPPVKALHVKAPPVKAPTAKPAPVAKAAPSPARKTERDQDEPTVSHFRKEPAGLNMDDFLPKPSVPSLDGQAIPADMSEAEAVSSIMKGHDSMMAVMSSRQRNLQIVRALWTSGNIKTAVDSALGMHDQAVIVDVLNVLIQKPALWNLDMCAVMVGCLPDLLSSKYENYVAAGCSALKLILKTFGPVIKSNITAPPSLGVDISREERYHKCKECYKSLMKIRSSLENKSSLQGKLGSKFRELQLLMSQLD